MKLTDEQCNEVQDILIESYGYYNEKGTGAVFDYINTLLERSDNSEDKELK